MDKSLARNHRSGYQGNAKFHLARRVQTRHARRAVEVGDDAAHREVGRRLDRDGAGVGQIAGLGQAVHEARELVLVDGSQVETSIGMRGDRAGHDIPRRQLVDEARAVELDERGAVAPQRLGQQQPGVGQDRRVELDELQVGQAGAGLPRDDEALADGADRVGRPTPQRGIAAGGEDRSTAPPMTRRSVTRWEPGDDPQRPLVLDDGDASVGLDPVDQDLGDGAAGLGTRDVRDAPPGVATLQAQVVVEGDAPRRAARRPAPGSRGRASRPRSGGTARDPR